MDMALVELGGKPFMDGLLIGLFVALVIYIFGAMRRRTLLAHLRSHMEIYHEGERRLQSEIEQLKEQVSNLKLRVAEYKRKPGHAELRELYLQERAIKLMNQRVPGFATVWESACNEIDEQLHKADSGLIAWSTRTLLPHSSWVKRMNSRLDALTLPVKKD